MSTAMIEGSNLVMYAAIAVLIVGCLIKWYILLRMVRKEQVNGGK